MSAPVRSADELKTIVKKVALFVIFLSLIVFFLASFILVLLFVLSSGKAMGNMRVKFRETKPAKVGYLHTAILAVATSNI